MKCEIIKDLIPSYIDGLTSKESNYEIELHLETCEECRACLEEMRQNLATPKVEMEDKVYMQVLKKVKKIEIERVALVASIAAIIAVFIFSGVHKYFYGIHDAGLEDLNVKCESIENKRKLIFESKDDEWLISVGYVGYSNESDEKIKLDNKEPVFIIGTFKTRKYQVPGGMKNSYTMEFLDEDTYIDSSQSEDTQFIDFDENDFIQIDLGTEKKVIKLSDLYDGNIESLR